MYDKKTALTRIPEKNESDEEIFKWVPKKKHEVLKAKYKCLKKLFQIYDASVIGVLPENQPETYEEPRSRRKKRSHRTKTDASAETTETSSGDVSICATDNSATTEIRDVNLYTSTQVSKSTISKISDKSDKSTQESKEDVSTEAINSDNYCGCVQTLQPHPIPYLVYNERRRPTRLQSFFNRLFGINLDEKTHHFSSERKYALSDNNITNRYEKRKRRGLRFRRRRPRKVHSEIVLGDVKSPMILSYVQLVQRNCLKDTTLRSCPILGCRMIFYGIINYNDHLNLCHFPDRKYICHYCHEGFSSEYDKTVHENEHIGINKLVANLSPSPSTAKESCKIASDTQTDPMLSKCDVPEDKLKKIVSFFDKISDPEQVIDQIKNNRYTESNMQSSQQSSESDSTEVEETKSSGSEKGILSCADMQKINRKGLSSANSDRTSNFPCGNLITCRFCGANFDFRRQLSHHIDEEHRDHDKFSKFHSCPVIINRRGRKTEEISSEDGMINVQSIGRVSNQSMYSEISNTKSVAAASCDPAANIVYYTSVESMVKKPSVVGALVQKIRSYKWEPGTKIIRV